MRESDYFSDELEKLSFKFTPALGATLTAAGIGGLWQGEKGYQQARERGEGVGQAMLSGLGRGAVGAAGGAALGAGIAAGAKHLGGTAGSYARGGQKSLYNLGGQQMHAVTGYGGNRGARAFGGGSKLTEDALAAAHSSKDELAKRYGKSGGTSTQNQLTNRWRQWRLSGKDKAVARAEDGHKAMQQAEDMGLTSLPGTIRSVKEHGARKSLRAAWNAQMKGMGPGGKALLFGLPAGFGVAGAMGGEKGREGEALGESAGMMASNVLPAAMSPSMLGAFSPAAHLMPTFIMSRPFMAAGKQLGRGADWARGKIKGGGEQ